MILSIVKYESQLNICTYFFYNKEQNNRGNLKYTHVNFYIKYQCIGNQIKRLIH